MIDPRLNLLRLVAHHGTITAAAEAAHYTPSAVSYQLRQLAADLDVTLLEEHGRGVRLTAAAKILLHHTEVLATQVERARADLAGAGGQPTGRFTLTGFSAAAAHLLPPAAAALRNEYPLVEVRVVEAEPLRCFDLLLAGDADLALVIATPSIPTPDDPRFSQQVLMDDPLDLIVPVDHPFTTRRRVSLADAAEEPWIVAGPDSPYRQLTLASCAAAGFTPNIAHEADEWDTGTALVAHGFGIFLVPRLARLADAWPVVRIPLAGDPAPFRRVLSVTRAGAREHPMVARALEVVEQIVAERA